MLHSTKAVTANDVKREILWNNRFITIDRSGFVYVKYLLNKNGTFYSHSKIRELFNVMCSFLDILQVRHSMLKNYFII